MEEALRGEAHRAAPGGGWRAWGTVRADFERALADHVDPAIASVEIASEFRRGADLAAFRAARYSFTGCGDPYVPSREPKPATGGA